jgi:hypothetical protein
MRSINTKFINCEWNYGVIECSIDMSSQASETLAALEMFTFNRGNTSGPKVHFRNSMLCGRFVFNYGYGAFDYGVNTANISDSSVLFGSMDTFVSVVQIGTPSNNIGGAWAVELDNISTNIKQYDSTVPVHVLTYNVFDRTVKPRNAGGQITKERAFNLTGGDGHLPTGGAAFYALMPLGSRITRIKFIAPSTGSSATANYQLKLGDGTVLSAITGLLNIDLSKDTFIGGNAGYLDTEGKQTISIVDAAALSVDGPLGGVVIYYE